jgi:hypothetical protein
MRLEGARGQRWSGNGRQRGTAVRRRGRCLDRGQSAGGAGGGGLPEQDAEQEGGSDVSESETGNGEPCGGRVTGSHVPMTVQSATTDHAGARPRDPRRASPAYPGCGPAQRWWRQ